MPFKGFMEATDTLLGKAKDFRYFVMLASFILFLDFALIVFKGSLLTEITYKAFTQDFHFGEVLIFAVLYTFFLSFVISISQYVLRLISALAPFTWKYFFYRDGFNGVEPKDYFYLRDLKSFAIKNNNSVADSYYNELTNSRYQETQLEYFSLGFLVATCLNLYAYSINHNALVATLIPFFLTEESNSFWTGLLTLILYALYSLCFYSGVIKGGRFLLEPTDKVFLSNHGFRNK